MTQYTYYGGSAGDDLVLMEAPGNYFFDLGAGDDVLFTEQGDHLIDMGAGNDTTALYQGVNTYLFGYGDGQDVVGVAGRGATSGVIEQSTQILKFKAGVRPEDVSFSFVRYPGGSGNGQGFVSLNGSGDRIDLVLLSRQFSRIEFTDSDVVWLPDDVAKKMFSRDESQLILGASVNNLIYGGGGNDTLSGLRFNDTIYGDDGNDSLIGDAGDDRLDGGAGNDTLIAGTGADTLIGGSGNDTYRIDDLADVLTEAVNGGVDTIETSVSMTLPANFERLVLTGSANINGTGTALGEELVGNVGANVLDALAGNDTLRGGAGDTLKGGAGDDSYFISDRNAVLIENLAEGTDTVTLQFGGGSYTLGKNIDNGIVQSGVATELLGNTLRNALTGGSGNDTLSGMFGADRLNGGDGDDELWGDAGTDRLNGGMGNDTYGFLRGDGDDLITNFHTDAGKDTVRFDEVDASQLWFSRDGLDLQVSVIGELDSVYLLNWYVDRNVWGVDRFVSTSSGKTLSADRVEGLVQAMAHFDPPPFGQTNLPNNVAQALAPALATAWQ